MEMDTSLSLIFSFSGGKDSCLSIYKILKKGYKIQALISTITENYNRVSIHGIREEILMEQVNSIGLPLHLIHIPNNCVNEEYEKIMLENLTFYKGEGIKYVGFGDIFLEDIRAYREKNLQKLQMKGLFPLWKQDTKSLINEFIDLGFKAIIVCVNLELMDVSFLGYEIGQEFLNRLPKGVDFCGENGEFHTFVYDGPIFKKPLKMNKGEVVVRGQLAYLDLWIA
jgi:uncharacterized protein (TIGR00290 family)